MLRQTVGKTRSDTLKVNVRWEKLAPIPPSDLSSTMGASNSDRVAWMYASIRIRYGKHDITDFKFSGRKELNRVRPSFRSCESKIS